MRFMPFPASAPTGPLAEWIVLTIRSIEGLAVADVIMIAIPRGG